MRDMIVLSIHLNIISRPVFRVTLHVRVRLDAISIFKIHPAPGYSHCYYGDLYCLAARTGF